MKLKNNFKLIVVVCTVWLSACSYQDPTRVEKDFGESVRNMVNQQIQNPNVAADPASYGPPFLDGESAVKTVEHYRSSERKRNAGSSLNLSNTTD